MKNQEEKIPEYVECVEYFSERYKNKIYNTITDLPETPSKLSWREILIEKGRLKDGSFKPSTKEAYEAQNTYLKAADYVPQVGDYVVMERAGGWGYSPDNNGCVAIVSGVGKSGVDRNEVFSIWGEVINPNNSRSVKFSNIPQFGYDKEVIFRKALPHEIPDVPEGPLEICRRKYKRGMLVRSALDNGICSGEFIIDVDPSEFYYTCGGVDYFNSKGWLYINGKFADILEEPKEALTKRGIENISSESSILAYPVLPDSAFPVKALIKQLKIVNFQSVHEIKTVEEKLLKKTKSKLFNI